MGPLLSAWRAMRAAWQDLIDTWNGIIGIDPRVKRLFDSLVGTITKLFTLVASLVTETIWPYAQSVWMWARQVDTALDAIYQALYRLQHTYLPALARWVLAAVNGMAASAYRGSLADRRAVVGGLVGELAGRGVASRAVIDVIERLAVDLVEVDNPVAGWLLQRAIGEVLRLAGADSAIASLIGDLTAHGPGGAEPRDLHGVIGDICARLNAAERWEARFMADGGPEILQAGEDWKDLTAVGTDAALLAFMALTITDPEAAANETARVLVPVADGAARVIRTLIR